MVRVEKNVHEKQPRIAPITFASSQVFPEQQFQSGPRLLRDVLKIGQDRVLKSVLAFACTLHR